MKLGRRHFLQSHVLGTAGLAAFSHPLLSYRQLLAAQEATSNKRLIFLFQRGGNDGINTIIPRGDDDYSRKNRPTLYIPEGDALDLGNGFAQAHPRLEPMMELYNHTSINGNRGAGNLAILHRIGYAKQSRSHFDSQEYWEKGVPGESDVNDGLFFRQLYETLDLSDPANNFVAASISSNQFLSLRGKRPFPNFRTADQFRFQGDDDLAKKILGEPSRSAPRASGVLGLYEEDPATMTIKKPYTNLLQNTGQALGATLKKVQDAVAGGGYEPENNAQYPGGSFGAKLQEAALLIKRTDVRILGLNIGGWDTHADQGQANGPHGNLLGNVALGFQALYRDLQAQWEDLIIVTMTEFGRTSKENGGKGTDHAESSVMFVAGGGVKGGVYNCDDETWKRGDMFSANKRYLSRRTDFRSIFGEIFMKHFGDDRVLLDKVIPGYSEAADADPHAFQFLDFIA